MVLLMMALLTKAVPTCYYGTMVPLTMTVFTSCDMTGGDCGRGVGLSELLAFIDEFSMSQLLLERARSTGCSITEPLRDI